MWCWWKTSFCSLSCQLSWFPDPDDLWQRGSAVRAHFSHLSINQSAKMFPCLWSSLCLVCAEAFQACNCSPGGSKCGASVFSSHIFSGNETLAVSGPYTVVSCCMNCLHELHGYWGVALLGKAIWPHQKWNQSLSIARISTRSKKKMKKL